MCKVVDGTTIEKVYEAFAGCGLELSDTFLVEPFDCDEETDGADDILTFTVTGQTTRGDWFYGNLPLFESEVSDPSAWAYAIEACSEEYSDLYVRNLATYGYDPASETPEYDEIRGVLDWVRQGIERLDLVA